MTIPDPFNNVECVRPDPGTSKASDTSTADTDECFVEVPDIHVDDPFVLEDNHVEFIPELNDGDSGMLYSDSSISMTQALSLLFSWFSAFPGLSKESFSRLLLILHLYLLPPGNKLPCTYASALKILKPYLTPVTDYHCCINDCIVYRNSSSGDFEKLTSCPVCSEPRYHHNGLSPQKRFKYLSIVTRLQRFFGNSKTSELMQKHVQSIKSKPTVVNNIHQSSAWKEWYSQSGMYHGESRSVSFALCTDGLNPFAHEKTQYSMWPIFLVPLNLPHSLRLKPGAMLLTGIIPGPQEPKNIDPYLDVIVDDILDLEKVTVYDAYRNEKFTLKGNILLHILDYPGQNKVFKSQGTMYM